MSGSGGGGVGPQTPDRDCASIFEETILNSPNADELEELDAEDILQLAIHEHNNQKSLVALTEKGGVAGSITSSLAPRIMRCIEEENYSFIAKIMEIDGGKCVVEIRPKSV